MTDTPRPPRHDRALGAAAARWTCRSSAPQSGDAARPGAGSRTSGSTAARSSAGPRRSGPGGRSRREWQAAWLLRAVTLMDLTTLSGDDTPGRVRRLCAKARRPVRDGSARGHGRRAASASGSPRSASTTPSSRPRSRRSRAPAFRSPRCPPGFPPGSRPSSSGSREIQRLGGRGRRGDRHRHHPGPRAHRELARALRRSARHARGLRRRAHQDHPRHRRAGHAPRTSRARAWSA